MLEAVEDWQARGKTLGVLEAAVTAEPDAIKEVLLAVHDDLERFLICRI